MRHVGTSPIDFIYQSGLVKDGQGFVVSCFWLIPWSRIAILLNKNCVAFSAFIWRSITGSLLHTHNNCNEQFK